MKPSIYQGSSSYIELSNIYRRGFQIWRFSPFLFLVLFSIWVDMNINGVCMCATFINSEFNSMLSNNVGGGVQNQEIYGLVNSPCGYWRDGCKRVC